MAGPTGRELLLALGVKAEPAALLSESYVDILDHSSVLRALVQVIPPDICKLLHREVVEALAPRYPMNFEPRRKLVARRQIVESLRTVAFVVVAAEAARCALPNPTRHGPRRAAFAPVLLDKLVNCYWTMFGCMPTVSRTDGEDRGGPSLKWLRAVLRIAADRLPPAGYEAIARGNLSARPVPPDQLLNRIGKLIGNSIETLGSDFEKAIARVKRGHPTFR
jgi:hypothetical protein